MIIRSKINQEINFNIEFIVNLGSSARIPQNLFYGWAQRPIFAHLLVPSIRVNAQTVVYELHAARADPAVTSPPQLHYLKTTPETADVCRLSLHKVPHQVLSTSIRYGRRSFAIGEMIMRSIWRGCAMTCRTKIEFTHEDD